MFCMHLFFLFCRRRERHAKTIDIAQEEVLTCLGIHLYERLHRIWQKLRAEEQTWQLLFHTGIDALRKSFEVPRFSAGSCTADPLLIIKYQPSKNGKGLTALRLSTVCGQMAVEKMQGISRLEQFVEALSEEERAKELKQEKKRQKRKNRRKNKCGFDSCEQEAEDKEKTLDQVTSWTHTKSRPLHSSLLQH